MSFIKKIFAGTILLVLAVGFSFLWWSHQAIITQETAIAFTILPGSGAQAAGQQMADAGVPIKPLLFNLLARVTSISGKLKAGPYELKPGTTPMRLIEQLVRGEFTQEALTIVEGWTFSQMRAAVAVHAGLQHDTMTLSEPALLALVAPDYKAAEGLFFPDTYLFGKGTSDLQIYRQAHASLITHLQEAWTKRAPGLPYKNSYEALTMASIIEKETGKKSERTMIAGVFVNRLRIGMMLQTDPSVIYGMGRLYDGKIRKRDLETDTPYNTYTRSGLPPTPISLPGLQSLTAALAPAATPALYFVSRGDGSSQFSSSLAEHNRAVNQYQR